MKRSPDKQVKDAFGQWSDEYDATVGQEVESYSGMSIDQFRTLLSQAAAVGSGDRVLDVGTGTALTAIDIARQGAGEVIALDITPEMIETARNNIVRAGLVDRITVREGKAEELPFPQDSFDLVTSTLAIHHMNPPRVVAEMIRVLRPGGRLVIADLGANARWRTPIGYVFIRLVVLGYLALNPFSARRQAEAAALKNVYTPQEWRQLLQDSTLQASEVKEYPHPRWKSFPVIFIACGRK